MQKTQLEFVGYALNRGSNVCVILSIHVCCLVKYYSQSNWNETIFIICILGILDFIKRGAQAVSRFESVVNQIQKNENDMESKLQSIAMANLLKFPIPDKTNDLPGTTHTRMSFI